MSLGRNLSPLPLPRKKHSLVMEGIYGEEAGEVEANCTDNLHAVTYAVFWGRGLVMEGVYGDAMGRGYSCYSALEHTCAVLLGQACQRTRVLPGAGYVRHPMYGGLLLGSLGLAILTRNESRLALVAVLWFVLENKVGAGGDKLGLAACEWDALFS